MDVKCELKDVHRMLFILCAASGLRFGEALGIEIPHVSPDSSCIHICQKAWRGQMHDFLKTRNGEREIDLHPSVAKLLREFIGTRKSGLLFRTRTGQQLHQSNILRRVLHPILEELGQPKCGVHAFRRFRNTYLRNYTSTPPGVYRFWMGHVSGEPERTGETMSDRYDRPNTKGRYARNGPKERAWASSFRMGSSQFRRESWFNFGNKIVVLDRMDRKPKFWPRKKWLQAYDTMVIARLFPGSSTVEHSAVNRRVASSNLARGANLIFNPSIS